MAIHVKLDKHPLSPTINLDLVAGYFPTTGTLLLAAPLAGGFNPITNLHAYYEASELEVLLNQPYAALKPLAADTAPDGVGFTRVTIPDIQVPK